MVSATATVFGNVGIPIEEALAETGLSWANDPLIPWKGFRDVDGARWVETTAIAASGTEQRLSTMVRGPGVIKFDWCSLGDATASAEAAGVMWVAGVKSASLWRHVYQKNTRWIEVATDDLVKLEWGPSEAKSSRFQLSGVAWQPDPERDLAESLDRPAGIVWSTSPDRPFVGRDVFGASGGTAARIGLLPGKDSWLEGTTEGPGVVDFVMKNAVSGNLYGCEVYVDGRKVQKNGGVPIWVTGAGPHRIRISFENSMATPQGIVVDQVTWEPFSAVSPSPGWTEGNEDFVSWVSNGAADERQRLLLTPRGNSGEWVEKTMTGPGVLKWTSTISSTGGLSEMCQVSVDGVQVPRKIGVSRNRLTIPAGNHTIRFSVIPSIYGFQQTTGDRLDLSTVWQLSDVDFTAGQGPVAIALDDTAMAWLEIGESEGHLVTGNAAKDKIDLWSSVAELHLLNLSNQSLKVTGWFSYSLNSIWKTWTTWLGARRSMPWKFPDTADRMDQFSAVASAEIPLEQAIDLPGTVKSDGWFGLPLPSKSRDGTDVAQSYLSNSETHVLRRFVTGPAIIRFSWKREGTGALDFQLNSRIIKNLSEKGSWKEFECAIDEGVHEISWSHSPGTEMLAANIAYLDKVSIVSYLPRTLADVVGTQLNPDITSADGTRGVQFSTGDSWKPTFYQDANGNWKDGAKVAASNSLMKMKVTGPLVIAFNRRCLDTSNSSSGSDGSSGSGFSMNATYYIGTFLQIKLDGVEVDRLAGTATAPWTLKSLAVAEGEHEITWEVISIYSVSGVWKLWPVTTGREAWVDDMVFKSTDANYNNWSTGKKLPAGRSHPRADADGDGVSNFFEYAYATDPLKGNSIPPKLSAMLQRADAGSKGSTSFKISVPYLPANFSGVVEESSDMRIWSPSSCQWKTKVAAQSVPSPGSQNTATHQEFQMPSNEGAGPKFYRLKLMGPP